MKPHVDPLYLPADFIRSAKILTALGVMDELSAERVDRALLRSARHLHVSSFFLLPGLGSGLAALFTEARAAGLSTSIDPNWDPRGAWDGGLPAVLATTDVLFVNAEEARRIARLDDVDAAARSLAARGCRVVVKCGAEGAFAVWGAEIVRAAAPPATVVDTVGAGDSFDAGFIAAVLAGRGPDDALRLAVACGSLSTRAAGGTAAQPTLAEAEGP